MAVVYMHDVQPSGNNFIDENHIDILGHLKILGEILQESWNEEKFCTEVDHFVTALENHFQHEETILRGAKYEDLTAHIIQHREIALKIRQDAFMGFDFDKAIYFLSSVRSKIFTHELLEDQSYWPVFKDYVSDQDDLIQWSEGLETGDEDTDAHHMALVRYINRLDRSIKASPDRVYIAAEMENLYAYSQLHFSEEEALLGVRCFDSHRSNHNLLLADLRNVMTDIKTGKTKMESVGSYLKYWLLNHVQTFDIPAFEDNRR